MIKDGDEAWEEMVPDEVANVIKTKCYFNYTPPTTTMPTMPTVPMPTVPTTMPIAETC